MGNKLRLVAAGAFLVAGLLSGCRNSGPTAVPGSDEPRFGTTTINGVALIHAPPENGLGPGSLTSSLIGLLGGSVAMDGANLRIPVGGLSVPTVITMEGKIQGRYQWKFGPNGLGFLLPATLTIAVDPAQLGIDPARLAVAVASDEGNDWQVVGGTYDPATRTISVAVRHFSQYALCQD